MVTAITESITANEATTAAQALLLSALLGTWNGNLRPRERDESWQKGVSLTLDSGLQSREKVQAWWEPGKLGTKGCQNSPPEKEHGKGLLHVEDCHLDWVCAHGSHPSRLHTSCAGYKTNYKRRETMV